MAGWARNEWQFYRDDGDHDVSTEVGSYTTDTKLRVDTTYQARQNYYHDIGTGNKVIQWQYSYEGGTWTNITTTSSYVKAVASGYITNGDDTTYRVGTTSGSPYETTNGWALSNTGVTTGISFTDDGHCNAVLTFQLVSGDCSTGDQIELRMYETNLTIQGTLDITVTDRRVFVA